MADRLLAVLSDAKDGREDEFNAWYTNRRLRPAFDRQDCNVAIFEACSDELLAPGAGHQGEEQ